VIDALFAAAIALGGYGPWCEANPFDCTQPIVQEVSVERLREMCSADGGCYMRTNVVFINDGHRRGSLVWRSIVVHEMVHHLQHKSGKWQGYQVNPCHRLRSEEEAYAAQIRYVEQHGGRAFSGVPPRLEVLCRNALDVGLVKDTPR
jgi:hypothetical protein